MKIIVSETLAKYSGSESTVYESEKKRVALQTEYEKVFTKFLFNINYPIYLVFG
jgi:hypothetical protein